MTSEKSVWYIPEHLLTIGHTRFVPKAVARRLTTLEERTWKAGLVGHREKTRAREHAIECFARAKVAPHGMGVHPAHNVGRKQKLFAITI